LIQVGSPWQDQRGIERKCLGGDCLKYCLDSQIVPIRNPLVTLGSLVTLVTLAVMDTWHHWAGNPHSGKDGVRAQGKQTKIDSHESLTHAGTQRARPTEHARGNAEGWG